MLQIITAVILVLITAVIAAFASKACKAVKSDRFCPITAGLIGTITCVAALLLGVNAFISRPY